MQLEPLEQFVIKPIVPLHIGKFDVSFTNSALLMTIAVLVVSAIVVIGTRREELVPGRIQSLGELAYEFVGNMIDETVGAEGQRYFPFIFTLFMFILFGNLLGLIPFGYSFTGQIIVTFAMAAVVFIGVTLIGIWRHGWHFLSFFVPHGVPFVLLVLLVPIELLSYLIRPFTLSIRLFANMLAGHTMLAIFGGFAASIGVLGLLPLGLDILIFFLELLVAVLQAYVFAILTCLYLNDAIHLH
ncbi:MAG: F0F1 ATP synthase subunit A [Alphaproteobacteria bacterium]|nr:F0F1 ATP synthase subunit A [Alphaproteobacteria bacterium]MDE1967541.1 F0F1 ATP synthase subunit A [Alphaproteobacteria bacterium]